MNRKTFMWTMVGAIPALWLASCKPKSPSFGPLIEISGESVKAKLDENFITHDCGKISHKKYLLPTREWVVNKLAPYWFEYRKRNNLMYDIDATNCESFAFQCHFASQELEGVNVTVGVFFYRPTANKPNEPGHAVNVLLINAEDRVKVVFFEPQTSQFIKLSPDDIASCSFFYF